MSLSEPFLAYAIYSPRRLRRFFQKLERANGFCKASPPANSDPSVYLDFLKQLAGSSGLNRLIIKETYRQDQAWDNVRLLDWIAGGRNPVAAITRHPYDAAVSTLKFCRWWRGLVGHVLRLWAPGLPLFKNDSDLMVYFAENWSGFVHWCRDRQLALTRYEDLVTGPEVALRRVCELCGIPFDSAMLDNQHPRAAFGGIGAPEVVQRRPKPINTKSVDRKSQLPSALREIVRTHCAGAAALLEYPM